MVSAGEPAVPLRREKFSAAMIPTKMRNEISSKETVRGLLAGSLKMRSAMEVKSPKPGLDIGATEIGISGEAGLLAVRIGAEKRVAVYLRAVESGLLGELSAYKVSIAPDVSVVEAGFAGKLSLPSILE